MVSTSHDAQPLYQLPEMERLGTALALQGNATQEE